MAPHTSIKDVKTGDPPGIAPLPVVGAPALNPAELMPRIEELLQSARAEVNRAKRILAILDDK